MDVSRITVVQGIYDRLARLEDDREVARLSEQDCTSIDSEMKALREELATILNQDLTIKVEVSDEKKED